MPKMKTNKAVAKRIKVTGRGKVIRHRVGASHLKSVKSPTRLRRMRKATVLTGALAKTARLMAQK